MKDFVFVDEWRIAAEPAQVWALVRGSTAGATGGRRCAR